MSDQVNSSPSPAEAAAASNSSNQSNEQAQVSNEAPLSLEPKAAEQAIDSSQLSPKEKVEAKKMLRKLSIKFNGKVLEEDLPFEIPDTDEAKNYMSKNLQMSKLAQSKSQQQAELEKEVTELVEQLRKNPKAVLRDPTIGIDLKKLAAEIIEEEIENSKKTPEQLRAEKAENELKELKKQREQEKEESKKRDLERLTQQEFEKYDVQVTQALEKTDLPKTPYVVKKMADYMILGLKNNINISPAEAINLVKEEMHEELKDMFSVMPEDVIEALIGKDTIKKLRKKDLAKARGNGTPNVPLSKAIKDIGKLAEASPKDSSDKKKTYKDFFGV